MRLFITGIGTDVGKTLVAAIACQALAADYWKPVQCGNLDASDSDEIRRLVGASCCHVFPEAYALPDPVSPHLAAARQGLTIDLETLVFPKTDRPLVIEGAGGALVPLNSRETVIDIARRGNCAVVVVSSCYLGSLNHTLLTVEALRARQLPIAGLVLNGQQTPGLEEVLLEMTGLPLLLVLPTLAQVHETSLRPHVDTFAKNFGNYSAISSVF